jgi:thymidylate synthase
MLVIQAHNVNDAYQKGMENLYFQGIRQDSRNGEVLEFPTPVTTVYARPIERVLFNAGRDANPFFHLHESLWMLAGRNDVKSVAEFVGTMAQFSDDGLTFHGAYGERWRGDVAAYDQLMAVIEMLREDPNTRRAVLQMWNADRDLGVTSKDLPCNTAVYFKIRNGHLNMTVTNRSNDMIWGAYGANAVHLSFLQEYIAGMVGVQVGVYYQVSDSLHAYINVFEKHFPTSGSTFDPYALGAVKPLPLVNDPDNFDADLYKYMIITDAGHPSSTTFYHNEFFSRVASPMRDAYRFWKHDRDYVSAERAMTYVVAEDWRLAGEQWLRRRDKRVKAKYNG